MVNIVRIEKAYLRFHNLHENLVFKVQKFTDDKTKQERFEVRCMNRFITQLDNEKDANELVEAMNASTKAFIDTEYNRFLDEIDKSNE